MKEMSTDKHYLELEAKVLHGQASLTELADFMRIRDLSDLPDYNVYAKESRFTRAWDCKYCGSEHIPCSIDCPQCGHQRISANFDSEQEGEMGKFRKKAHTRK